MWNATKKFINPRYIDSRNLGSYSPGTEVRTEAFEFMQFLENPDQLFRALAMRVTSQKERTN